MTSSDPLHPSTSGETPTVDPVDRAPVAGEALPNPAGKRPEAATGPGADTESPIPPGTSDRVMLEGPHGRFHELVLLARAMRDFIRGFRVLHFVGPCVTVFGSARFHEPHPYYTLAREVGRRTSELGFTVMTGGGPGLMEAANRGARDVGGRSVGCNIELPMEQEANPYLDRWISCHYFFVRKVLLFKYSYAFIALPGGLGTLDELCEALTLIQTGKIRNFPVVLIGTDYWKPFVDLLHDMLEEGAISPTDLDLLKVTDDIDEAMAHLEKNAVGAFGLKRVPWREPKWWLGEHGLRWPIRANTTPQPQRPE
jgi:uncharacterized protein (TIGR00730 family)